MATSASFSLKYNSTTNPTVGFLQRAHDQRPKWPFELTGTVSAASDGTATVTAHLKVFNATSGSGNAWSNGGTIEIVWFDDNTHSNSNLANALQIDTTGTMTTWPLGNCTSSNLTSGTINHIILDGTKTGIPMKSDGSLTGFLSVKVSGNTSRGYFFNSGYTSTGTQTITRTSYTLTINPNGGSWNGSTSSSTHTQRQGSTLSIPNPTRSGYYFVGWIENSTGSLAKQESTHSAISDSSHGISIYNNSGESNGVVTHTLVNTSDSSWTGAKDIQITTASSGSVSPGLGGFRRTKSSAANKVFIHAFRAKIPTGYTVQHASNATGDGSTWEWLTDNIGTGSYQTYAYKLTCGSSGSFSTFGYAYIYSGSRPVTWYLSCNVITDVTSSGDTYTFGSGTTNGTLTALWAPIGHIYYYARPAYADTYPTGTPTSNCKLVSMWGHDAFIAWKNDSTALVETYNRYETSFDAYATSTLLTPPTGYHHASKATNWKLWNATKGEWINSSGISEAALDFSAISSDKLSTGDSLVLFANWQPNTYTVNYYHAGSKVGSSTHTYDTAKALTTFATLGISISGYNPDGWARATNSYSIGYTNGQSVSNLVSTNGGSIDLYSVFKRTATWYSGINKATSVGKTQYAYYNGTTQKHYVSNPGAPTAITGWTTLGWRNDTTAGAKEIDSTASYTGTAQTLYAVYSTTATFYSGYNKASSSTETAHYNSANVSSVSAPAPTVISGWTARGWRADTTVSDRSYAVTTATTMTGFGTNKTFYHVYSRTGTVTYNANGGSGTTSASTSEAQYLSSASTSLNPASLSVTLRANGFTYPGYTFTKWDLGNANASYSWTPAYNASTAKTAKAQWSMNQQIWIKVGNTWHKGAVWVNVGGTWKKATSIYQKVGSTWKTGKKL